MLKREVMIKRAKVTLQAAEQSFKREFTATDLAAKNGLSRSSVTQGRMILEFGTPEEKQDALSGQKGLRIIAETIRRRLTPEVRKELSKRVGIWTVDRRENLHDNASIWARLGPALRHLTELPNPEDVINVVKANGGRELTVNTHLNQAAKWLEEFANAWRKQQERENDPDNARDGSQHVGDEQA